MGILLRFVAAVSLRVVSFLIKIKVGVNGSWVAAGCCCLLAGVLSCFFSLVGSARCALMLDHISFNVCVQVWWLSLIQKDAANIVKGGVLSFTFYGACF
jgi:hypothetical protein